MTATVNATRRLRFELAEVKLEVAEGQVIEDCWQLPSKQVSTVQAQPSSHSSSHCHSTRQAERRRRST